MDGDRVQVIEAFEQDAETLVVYETDVIAQIENQLRAARQTMRLVEKLRGLPHRVGPELTNPQRHDALDTLSSDWAELDRQLTTQR